MKKVGIIGSGGVAKTLAAGFQKHGYKVMLGTRDASKLAEFQEKTGGKIAVGTMAEAARFGKIIVLAVKGKHAKEALKLAEAKNLRNKTILDATNPIDESKGITNGALHFFTKSGESLMGNLQKTFKSARFVKAFNSVGAGFMVNPQFPGGEQPTMFICGADAGAKAEATEVLTQFGWATEDVGGVELAGAVEQLCILWCAPGFLRNQWTHAFRLLKL